MEFTPFRKIPRLRRDIVITEKIDGTNAQVVVGEDGSVRAGSRSRFITPENDNFGFAAWVAENESGLAQLGPGIHYGEWWGQGIQRKYGLDHKRFSLFNVSRWRDERPACCHVVPILYEGPFTEAGVNGALAILHGNGSQAAPGFPKPEGVIIYHEASNALFKVTLEKDEAPKSRA